MDSPWVHNWITFHFSAINISPTIFVEIYFISLLTYKKPNLVSLYNLMSLELRICPWNHHHNLWISFVTVANRTPTNTQMSTLNQSASKKQRDHNGVITHLEPHILECEVKWALESITMNKASGGDGIPVERFQILKDDVVKVLQSICQQIWKTQQSPQDWKRSVFIPIPKKGSAKECSNYRTIVLISHASKVMLKILQARLQQYVNHELPDV